MQKDQNEIFIAEIVTVIGVWPSSVANFIVENISFDGKKKKGRANFVIQVGTCYSGLCLYQLLSGAPLSKAICKHLKM